MKSEVRALEQAVCGLVAKLDVLLVGVFGLSILDANNGLHITTPDHLSEHREDAFVPIRPVGWPNSSYISARFLWHFRGWELHEGGEILADHLPAPIYGLSFKPSDCGLGISFSFTPQSCQRQLLADGYTQLITSLQKDAEVHHISSTTITDEDQTQRR